MKCLEIREGNLDENHLDLALIYNNLGVILYHIKEYIPSLEYLKRCYHIRRKIYPEYHPEVQSVLRTCEVVMKTIIEIYTGS